MVEIPYGTKFLQVAIAIQKASFKRGRQEEQQPSTPGGGGYSQNKLDSSVQPAIQNPFLM